MRGGEKPKTIEGSGRDKEEEKERDRASGRGNERVREGGQTLRRTFNHNCCTDTIKIPYEITFFRKS